MRGGVCRSACARRRPMRVGQSDGAAYRRAPRVRVGAAGPHAPQARLPGGLRGISIEREC